MKGSDKLTAVRAAIRAIDKVGLAKEVRQQKLLEAQDIADAVLDAEVRIGELTSCIPKVSGGDHGNQYTSGKKDTAVHFEKREEPPAPVIAEKAKERQAEAGGAVPQKSAKAPIDTREKLATIAGVSHDTIAKVEKIVDKAPEPVIKAARAGDLSINAAHEVTRMGFEQQREIADRIEQGEAPREVVDEVKKRDIAAGIQFNRCLRGQR